MRPSNNVCAPPTGVCAPQPAVCACSNLNHPKWQRCSSHRGQSKSIFTLSKVNKTLTLIGRTRTLSYVTDGRDGQTHRRTDNPANSKGVTPILHWNLINKMKLIGYNFYANLKIWILIGITFQILLTKYCYNYNLQHDIWYFKLKKKKI
jgi:hypothetical protein